MTTRRLYYDDSFQDNFTAHVLSCQPLADSLAGQDSTCWGVLLDQTHLYPASGGQPNDLGKLGEANVLDVRDLENDEILHVVDRPVPTGRVDGCIDWPRRFDHMQQHTGQHLLSAVFQERFGLPTVSFHLGEFVSTIDLRGPQPAPQILEGAARAANAIVFEDREITVRYGTAEQFARMGVRKQVERAGTLRAIEIAGIDLQPCGGTHVRRTGQIGTMLLRGCTKIRQDWRVEFLCGHRAEAAARRDAELVAQIAAQLRCSAQDCTSAVNRILQEKEDSSKALRSLLPRLAEKEAGIRMKSFGSSSNGLRVVGEVLLDVLPEYLQFYATALVRSEGVIALLGSRTTGALVFAQNPAAAKDMNGLLKQVLEQFPGKGGGNRDFARGSLTAAADAEGAIKFAESLL